MRRFIVRTLILFALVGATNLHAGQREEAYQRLTARLQQAQKQKAQLQERRDQAQAAKSRIAKDRQGVDAARRDLSDSAAAGVVDYSRYDRCPNGHAWGECNHAPQKEEWLREQTDKNYRFRKSLERIMDDLLASQQAVQDQLSDYATSAKSYNDETKALKDEVGQIKKEMAEFRGLPDVAVDPQVDMKIKETVTAELAKRPDGYERREDGLTQCNIFASDYAKNLLGRDVPQLLDATGAAPAAARDQLAQLTKAVANNDPKVKQLDWGNDAQAVMRQTVELANQGKLVVFIEPTHVSTVVPSARLHDSGSWKLAVPYVTQAGAKVAFPDQPIPLSEAWSSTARTKLKVFVVDP